VEQVIELEVPARLEFLAMIRRLVSATARVQLQWDDQRLADLELAVSEACTNAIEAHTAAQAHAPVAIRVSLSAERVEVTVVDRARGFDPDALDDPPSPTDPRRLQSERGMGIPIMCMIADEADFRPTPSGTAVRLVLRDESPS
jgi:serine/threonine-protein kinase RsbW